MGFKMGGWSAFTKTIAKDKDKPMDQSQSNWEPAFPGGDHSINDLKQMSTKEIVDYYGMTEDEAKKYSKESFKPKEKTTVK